MCRVRRRGKRGSEAEIIIFSPFEHRDYGAAINFEMCKTHTLVWFYDRGPTSNVTCVVYTLYRSAVHRYNIAGIYLHRYFVCTSGTSPPYIIHYCATSHADRSVYHYNKPVTRLLYL